MAANQSELATERLIYQILHMYYEQNINQAKIGEELGLSSAKINRLLKQARSSGWIEINIRTPNHHLLELEDEVERRTGVRTALVVPRISDQDAVNLRTLGSAAAEFLLGNLRDKDVISLGGGRGVAAMVTAIDNSAKPYDVLVVPALGGVQGRYVTDVNNLVQELAQRLGGTARLLYAPAFADNHEDWEMLTSLRQVKEVLDQARKATVAVVGVGALDTQDASLAKFINVNPASASEVLRTEEGVGEILARVMNPEGEACAPGISNRVVGLSLAELKQIPLTIGIAALEGKARAVSAALRGNYLNVIIMDERTAEEVLTYFE